MAVMLSYKKYGCTFALVLLIPFSGYTSEIVVEGRSGGATLSSREQALTDALREAVRLGAGVNIASQSSTSDFALEYDRVFAAAFGYVKSYKVLESGMEKDGLYHVKIQADVGQLDPNMNSSMAMRQLVELKGSPRVALDLHESIGGIPADSHDAEAWFEEKAKDMQLVIVDPSVVRNQELKLARRDDILGGGNEPSFHGSDITQKADFIIQGNVKGRYEGLQSIFGSRPRHVFAMSASLRAIRPETGEVIASETIQPREYHDSNEGSVEMAAKDIITKLLNGNESQDQRGAQGLFRKIFATWASELDLGRTVRVEILKIDESSLRNLVEKLKGDPHVSGVWEREFDSRVGSILDVETRLSSPELTGQITKILGGYYSMEHGTQHYISFVHTGGQTLKNLNDFIGKMVGGLGKSDAKWDPNETYAVWIEGVEANPKTPAGNRWHDDGTAPNLVVSLTWRNNILLETSEAPNALIAQWDSPVKPQTDITKADVARIHAPPDESIDLEVRDRGLLNAQWVGGGKVPCGRLKPGRNILTIDDPKCGLKSITLRIIPSADLQKNQRTPARINRVFVGSVLDPPPLSDGESVFQRSKAGRFMQQGIQAISCFFKSSEQTTELISEKPSRLH